MKSLLKKVLVSMTPDFIKYEIEKPYLLANQSYSQEGEDLILNRFLDNKKNGFYVDVGAHHPYRFSNTYFFYKRGWRGINIDAMPGSMQAFSELRPNDTNLEIGVGLKQTISTFYIFNEPALNTFSKVEAKRRNGMKGYCLIDEKDVEVKPMNSILAEYISKKQTIDFMSIDVEGRDLEVLLSNDWEKYRPNFLLVEDLQERSIEDIVTVSNLYQFLKNIKYQFISKSYNTLFFKNTL